MNEKKKKWICYGIILIVATLMCYPLFRDSFFSSHDGDFHMARSFGTLEQIRNGNSIFVIARYSHNLGFAWNLFYPPVSTFISAFFELLSGDVAIGMKCFIFLTYFLSGISMFKLVNDIYKDKKAAIIASVIYMTAPYRILNTYTRLAVGEMASFIFIPMIFRGVYYILNEKMDKKYIFIFGTILLLLSHNISTLLVFILGFILVCLNIKKIFANKKTILWPLIGSLIIIVLSVLFFEIPLIETKMGAEYEVFRYGKMYSRTSVMGHALNPLQLLFRNADGTDSSMYFCIGLPILIGLILTLFYYKKNKDKELYRYFLLVGVISLISSTFIFPWIMMPSIILMIQFPWRLLEIVIFALAIIAGINFSSLINSFNKKWIKYGIISLIILISSGYALTFTKNIEYKVADNNLFLEEEIIDTKNHVSRYSSFLEYWPQKAIKNIDYINRRDQKVLITDGEAKISNESKVNGVLDFDIDNVYDDTTLELPYLYYKGYVVRFTDNNGNKKVIDCYENEMGLVSIKLKSGDTGHIEVKYEMTKLHKICLCISLTTMTMYIGYLGYNLIKKRKI